MENEGIDPCGVESTLKIIGGKWKPVILYRLGIRPMRYNELRRAMARPTQKMLTQQLRELEQDGIVLRTAYDIVPPKVEYSLTPYGQTLKPLLKMMCDWGKQHARAGA